MLGIILRHYVLFFAQNNIQLLTVTDINGDGLQVEAMRQVGMVFSEMERKMGAMRTKEGIRGKIALGQFPYHAPYGYKNKVVIGEKYKKMVIDEDTAFYIRQAYDMCLQGDSIQTITSKLYTLGFRNKHGNRIAKSTVEYILHNIAYIGKFYYDGILYEDTKYPKLIDEAVYYSVQEKLNSPKKTRQTHTSFAYDGVLKCSKCGCALTGEAKYKKNKDGSIKRKYVYYHCTGNRGGDCKKNSYIREELLDESIASLLKNITIPDNVINAVFEGLKTIHKSQGENLEITQNLIRKRINKIDKNIKDAFESGMYKRSQSLQKTIEDWEVERKKLIIEEQEITKNTKTFFEQSNLLLEFCKDCNNAFFKENAEQKRTIVKIVCSNFSYNGSKLIIEPTPVFKYIIKSNLNKKILPRLDSNQQPTG